ncbi:methyl-accepting chemotaxis protein [Propionivibrio soli]|uniref:methyl-accepting chemotaxis protein n=1 Tax=Propionivibrio soli TaxID=2976531 RepID=UPI0021E7A26A|nr:methyl-accepting chemotaxis protein [Propionivibrio soli]
MKLRIRILIIVAAALLGMLVMAAEGLYQLRQSMYEERRSQIVQLLDVANAQFAYFHEQEKAGKLTREEAQARAKESISAQRTKDNYFIVRNAADNMLLVHGNASRVGKIDPGGKTIDGRQVMEVYKEEIARNKDGKGFVMLEAVRPGTEDKTMYKKLNGATMFEPWGWLVAIGFFVDDIDRVFWHDAIKLLITGGVLIAVVSVLAAGTMRSILGQLGGEPAFAAGIAKNIASGDLTQTIDARAREESLIGSMRAMQSGLHDMVARFNDASTTLTGASKHLKEETQHISRGSQMISEATSSTAAAIEEMTVSINHISESARETETNSQQAAELATQGESLVKEAAAEIRRISNDISTAADLIRGLVERSREIDSMSAVIREIADQTNLLALNAAIEAARAGEQGRGFAVVADEVRKLAERTGGATQDITRTIRAVQADTDMAANRMDSIREQVALGVELSEKAAQALREIDTGAHATLEKTRDVANAAQEQSQASNSIATNVERIAQMVEEAEASVRSAHAQVEQLDGLARELNQAAGRFRL